MLINSFVRVFGQYARAESGLGALAKARIYRQLTTLTLGVLLALGLSSCTTWRKTVSFLTQHAPRVFHTDHGQILTPQGTIFIARGINLQYGDNPQAALPALAAIASVHANIVRLQLRKNTTAAQLKAALDEAVRLKLPIMVFYWESYITCGEDATVLKQDVQALWLKRWAGVLSDPKYQPYLMLNVANEWGTSKDDYATYLATYTDLIKAMRARGYRTPLVIDAADCGANTDSFLDGRGQALEAADPLHNLIVSVHAYHDVWNSHIKIDQHIDDLKASGVPFLLGEFGDTELDLPNDAVDHIYLMQTAQAKSTGWIVWSWKGNGKETHMLDMSDSYGDAKLTRRGEQIVNGPYGLRATAQNKTAP